MLFKRHFCSRGTWTAALTSIVWTSHVIWATPLLLSRKLVQPQTNVLNLRCILDRWSLKTPIKDTLVSHNAISSTCVMFLLSIFPNCGRILYSLPVLQTAFLFSRDTNCYTDQHCIVISHHMDLSTPLIREAGTTSN